MNGNLIDRKPLELHGVGTEILSCGAGEACFLFLHPERGLGGSETFLRQLAEKGRVVAPFHPGFRNDAPDHFKSVDDLSYFYLDLMDALDLRDVTLVGASLGGWLAMEIASKSTSRVSSMCLLAPAGVKIAGRSERDMQDIFSLDPKAATAMSFHDAERFAAEGDSDEAMELALRAREASARYAWLPYMHNPKLGLRLHRVDVPTLVLWGRDDRIAAPGVGEALAERLPCGEFKVLETCGHYPHIECSDLVAAETSKWRTWHLEAASAGRKGAA